MCTGGSVGVYTLVRLPITALCCYISDQFSVLVYTSGKLQGIVTILGHQSWVTYMYIYISSSGTHNVCIMSSILGHVCTCMY